MTPSDTAVTTFCSEVVKRVSSSSRSDPSGMLADWAELVEESFKSLTPIERRRLGFQGLNPAAGLVAWTLQILAGGEDVVTDAIFDTVRTMRES
jgi:hypothetical protein